MKRSSIHVGSRTSRSVVNVGISKGGRAGPGNYELDRNLTAAIIVAKDGKVAHSFVFLHDFYPWQPHILGAIADVMDVDHATLREWITGQVPPSRGAATEMAR